MFSNEGININTQKKIIDHLKKQESIKGYITQLVEEDMERKKKEKKSEKEKSTHQ